MPRGAAKKDVYRDLEPLLDNRTTAWERARLRQTREGGKTDFRLLLAEEVARVEPPRLSHSERATILTIDCQLRKYEAARHSDRAVQEAMNNAPEDAHQLLADSERERDECLVALGRFSRDAEVRAASDDLRVLSQVAVVNHGKKDGGFTSYTEAKQIAREGFESHGRPIRVIPERLERLADKELRRRRYAERKHAKRYEDQLANLPILDPKRQALTIADWKRNINNQKPR